MLPPVIRQMLDIGWDVSGITAAGAACFAVIPVVLLPPKTPKWVRGVAGCATFLLGFTLLSAGYQSFGVRTEGLHVVRLGDMTRLATVHRAKTNAGGHCRIRVFDLDGRYVGGTQVDSTCGGELAGGRLVLPTDGGLFSDRDVLVIDLWTGRRLGWLSERVAGPHRLLATGRDAAQVQYADGRTTEVPWPADAGATAERVPDRTTRAHDDPRFDAQRLETPCGDRMMIRHRSVAFGDGSTLLSAHRADKADALWTTDLTAAWGDLQLLGVVEHAGRCFAVGGAWGGNVEVLPLPDA